MVSIATGDVLAGSLPPPKLRAVLDWLADNREEVAFAWDELAQGRPFKGPIG